MNDDFLQKLMQFIQMRQGGPLVPMSSGGVPMGSANDYLQPPRPPMPDQAPAVPRVDLQTLLKLMAPQQAPDMTRFGVNGAFPAGASQFPSRLPPHAVGVRG